MTNKIIHEDYQDSDLTARLVVAGPSEYVHHARSKTYDTVMWSGDVSPDQFTDQLGEAGYEISGGSERASLQLVKESKQGSRAEGLSEEILEYVRGNLSNIALVTLPLRDGARAEWVRPGARIVGSDARHNELRVETEPGKLDYPKLKQLIAATATQTLRDSLDAVWNQIESRVKS